MNKIKRLVCFLFSAYGFLPMVLALGYNCAVYWISSFCVRNAQLHSLFLPIDSKIPLVSWTVIIYFGCYIFWIINYTLIYRESREYAYRFFIADFLSRTVCFLIFVIWPTTIVRPEITGSGFWDRVMAFLYRIDRPVNLFPSIHCLVSWNCFIGIRKSAKVPGWYKVFSFVFALLIFLSTLTTRQHVILDAVGGVVLSEICYLLACRTGWWHYVEKGFDPAGRYFLRRKQKNIRSGQ